MKMKYRIREFRGEFTIQILRVEYHGFFWWKKQKLIWEGCTDVGNYISNNPFYDLSAGIICPSFESLGDARRKIQSFQQKPIYHFP